MEKKEIEELAKRYNVDLRALEKEQEKLAKTLEIKDTKDFSDLYLVAGIDNVFMGNVMISAVVICDVKNNFEVVESNYHSEKVRFPYLPGFRAYREVPVMLKALEKMDEKPEIVFIKGHGIAHGKLGIASHFSLVSGIPTIGISENILDGEIKKEDILIKGKVLGKVINSKEGSKPLYISPGNFISVKTAFEITKEETLFPHKLPEPLHLAHKHARKILKEMNPNNNPKFNDD